MRARETGARSRVYGIPSGGALLVEEDGEPRALGVPAAVFAASVGQKARAIGQLAVRP